MIKELQYHPVTDSVIHIDLMRVRRSEKIKISVPLILIGDAIGIKEGGVLSQAMTQIEIECYPTDVPEQIELDITDLQMNNAYSIADVKITNDEISIVSGLELNVVSINPPAVEEETLVGDEELIDGDEIEDEEPADAKAEKTQDGDDNKNEGDSSKES